MYRILIVEDDVTIAEVIAAQLSLWGHETRTVGDFQHVMAEFAAFDPHLVLVDVMLPYFNGYHWCNEIRRASQVPVVFLSSAADNMNIIMAMNMGADDFIAKPVDLSVLMAKVNAILRRSYDLSGKLPALEHGGAMLNLSDGSLLVGETRVELTKNEFRILETLMQNHGRIVSREALMNALWQNDCYVEENTLTVNVGRLRKKLEAAGLNGYIVTRPGSGYIVE